MPRIVIFLMGFCLVNSAYSITSKDFKLSETTDKYDEVVFGLKVNNKKYLQVSYYEDTQLYVIDRTHFRVESTFSTNETVQIDSFFEIKNNELFLNQIMMKSTSNMLPPNGGEQICVKRFNLKFTIPIYYYVDHYFFSEKVKTRFCKTTIF